MSTPSYALLWSTVDFTCYLHYEEQTVELTGDYRNKNKNKSCHYNLQCTLE